MFFSTCCSDVMCGQLHCNPADELASFLPTMAYKTIDSHIIDGRGKHHCDSVIIDIGSQISDPALAPDGAWCDDGKVIIIVVVVTITFTLSEHDLELR